MIGEKAQLAPGGPQTAAALRKYAFESTGQMRGVSIVAEKAIREYLEKNVVKIPGQD